MSRLPVNFSDLENWGTILNDYLSVSHAADGTLKSLGVTQIALGAPSGGDDTATIQAAVNALSGTGGTIIFPAGTFSVTQVTVPANITLRGAGRGKTIISMAGASAVFTASGSRTSAGSLSVNTGAQATTITLTSITGVSAGDYVLIRSSAVWPGTDKGATYGEIARVKSKTSTTLTFYEPLDEAYLVSDTTVVEKLTMLTGVQIERLTIRNLSPGTVSANSGAIFLQYTVGANVSDVALEAIDGPGVTIATSVNWRLDIHCKDLTDDSANSRYGYGVNATESARDGEAHVYMRGGRHAFTTNSNGLSGNTSLGVPRHIKVYGIATGTTNAAWDTHFEGAHITFESCIAHQCNAWGYQVRAQDVTINNPVVHGAVGAGIFFRENASRFVVNGGSIRHIKGGVIESVTYAGNGLYYNPAAAPGTVINPDIQFTDDDSIFIDGVAGNANPQDIFFPHLVSPGQSGSNNNGVRITSPSPASGTHRIFRPKIENATNGLNAGASVVAQMPLAVMISVTNRLTGGIDTTSGEAIDQFKVLTNDPAQVALVLKAAASQSADVFQVLDTTNGNKFRVGSSGNAEAQGFLKSLLALIGGKANPVYSASITPSAVNGNWQAITVTNATAFTINAPTNPPDSTHSQSMTIEIINSSGGVMGAITWNAAFILVGGAFTNPASTKKRFIRFEWSGTAWVETSRASADY